MPEPCAPHALQRERPCIAIGAFDRHNFGDLLFPHLAAALLPGRRLVFTGLAARDLRRFGGHCTRALADVVQEFGRLEVDILHAGGEVLACGAWPAAAMLLAPAGATSIIARLESDGAQRQAHVQRVLRVPALAPYIAGRALFPGAHAVVCCGVGGVGLLHDPAMRDEIVGKLRDAEFVGVRERVSLALLRKAGIPARLMPDPAVLLPELFGPLLAERAQVGECAGLRAFFPAGYLAVQCSVEYGDDATLGLLAQQLDRVARETGLGVVLFRAGAAPWHDDTEVYARLQGHLRHCRARLFGSLDVFDICALIAASAGYCGSSLHGRIVAMGYGLPRVSLCHDGGDACAKTSAFAACWDARLPAAVSPADAGQALLAALSLPAALLGAPGTAAAGAYRRAFEGVRAALA